MRNNLFLTSFTVLIGAHQIHASDSENPNVPSFISANVIIGATAMVLCLALAYSVFRLRRCRLNPMAKFQNDTSNEDPELNNDGNETNIDCLDANCSFYNLNDHEKALEQSCVDAIKLSHEETTRLSYCLKNFEDGNIDGFNPNLMLDEQADLLPYDRKFEFPREKLQLGPQLGTGAFGVVFKATANGIVPNEEQTTVAVKTVKSIAGDEVLRALALELKILIHLGKHLNVVNLLGAITENISKRELLLIVEYCQFGNLQHFLVKHRVHFVDQLNREEDRIDSKIKPQDPGVAAGNGYVAFNSVVPVRWITTTDLLIWSFQIARGMHYLASRKVLHGDLAARNILLCEKNVVKICDFGLARSIYKTGDYHIRTERALPFKWLALESISDQVFSTYSDVWSFGIVLWELLSLGTTPYPGMSAGADLFLKLRDGYRMEKPTYATQELYKMMLSCWQEVPTSRPLFDELQEMITNMLDKSVCDHYVLLNEPYQKMNVDRYNSNQIDYSTMLTPHRHSAQSTSASIQYSTSTFTKC